MKDEGSMTLGWRFFGTAILMGAVIVACVLFQAFCLGGVGR